MSIVNRFRARHPKASQPGTTLRSAAKPLAPLAAIKWLGFKTTSRVKSARNYIRDGWVKFKHMSRPRFMQLNDVERAVIKKMRNQLSDYDIKALGRGGRNEEQLNQVNRVFDFSREAPAFVNQLETALMDAQSARNQSDATAVEKRERNLVALNRSSVERAIKFPFEKENSKATINQSFSQQIRGIKLYGQTVTGLKGHCEDLMPAGKMEKGTFQKAVSAMLKEMKQMDVAVSKRLKEIEALKSESKSRVKLKQEEVTKLAAFKMTLAKLEKLESDELERDTYLGMYGEQLGLQSNDAAVLDQVAAGFLGSSRSEQITGDEALPTPMDEVLLTDFSIHSEGGEATDEVFAPPPEFSDAEDSGMESGTSTPVEVSDDIFSYKEPTIKVGDIKLDGGSSTSEESNS